MTELFDAYRVSGGGLSKVATGCTADLIHRLFTDKNRPGSPFRSFEAFSETLASLYETGGYCVTRTPNGALFRVVAAGTTPPSGDDFDGSETGGGVGAGRVRLYTTAPARLDLPQTRELSAEAGRQAGRAVRLVAAAAAYSEAQLHAYHGEMHFADTEESWARLVYDGKAQAAVAAA